MNDIDKMPVKCRDCPYWELAVCPWNCWDCKDRLKKPVSDFVSRQWLIDEYHRRHEGPPGGALKMIEEAPAAEVEPKRRWIPVTERLPEVEEGFTDCESFEEDKDGEYYPIGVYTCWESEPVLIFACIDGTKERYTARYEEWRFADGRPKECGWIDVSGDVELSFVTHWMPLPEPPKEEEDGKL